MLKILQNASIYSTSYIGKKDILFAGEKIVAIEDRIEITETISEVIDLKGSIVTSGLIDQHVHIIGAGGKHGFGSMTPEIMLSEFIKCGTTTVVGLLGTDGSARSIKTLYAKSKSLESEGLSAYIYTSYFGLDAVTFTESIQDDMIFIDKVLGCKVAISDERSSYPLETDLLRQLKQVRVGGLIAGKKGILHIHLGSLSSKMEILLKIVKEHGFPIEHISPTHVGRTLPLFEQAIEFAKLGGMIDITSGGTKYTDPYKSVLYALEKGVSIDNMTFSSDGNAGIGIMDANGATVGFKKAPIHLNLEQVKLLIKEGKLPIEEAFKLITSNPAKNLALKQKGHVKVGFDADICVFDTDLNLTDVFSRGKQLMKNSEVIVYGNFENILN
ncbi:beta-aspartyl-dipeptidase (metallo-type) [Lutibacter agarilyticus]|uniref:Isoaspartyl dipeptidase n=1 Tax=Lutibacter agarilyticus TaxID=1109740 RepID=A0A238VW26_9FLAO|nr:beta-aspartyl-peptidase [Lutibacter agarilyticus]SNR38486.1 beta-aspartyl-dipeptidase (metallo-type) [Lutibacter agarilyticus]